MWNLLRKSVGTVGYWIGDQLTDWTGLAAIRIPLEQASNPREVTLDLPGYMQTNGYACGAITAAMIVQYFRPRMSFARIYDAVNPRCDYGAGKTQVIQALRACGLRVSQRTKLRFAQIRKAIDQGRPIMTVIHNPGSDSDHWVVIYGYCVRPNRVFLATNGLPWCDNNRIARRQFERLWKPPGNGLICWKASR
jgi:ABC-type bacteriocin/lantibiotic exporter with double-glycine peptidase domain